MSEMQFEVPVRNSEGKEIERLRIDPEWLDERVRPRLLKEAVLMYQANRRVGTHETKTRSRVSGSNKKPWRQKGTGRARAGTRKSPLWRGGGIIFGPHPRSYSTSLPKKMRKKAIRSALFAKFRDGEVQVVEGLKVEKPSTRTIAGILKSLGITSSCLIGTDGLDKNLYLSARNIPRVKVLPVQDFNALEILASKTIVLTREGLGVLAAPEEAAPEEATREDAGAGGGAPGQEPSAAVEAGEVKG